MLTKKSLLIGILLIAGLIIAILFPKKENLPLVAIANYGPHASLDASIHGVKDALAQQGFIENKTVRFEILNVGFDATLIPQMIATLKNHHPQVLITLTTPVAQFAKGAIKDIPVIYDVITDPIAAGLIKDKDNASNNMTGSSDKQDLNLMFNFAKQLIPNIHSVGLLYAPAEVNDIALLHAMQKASSHANIKLIAHPVANSRDISLIMQQFKGKADMIYVGSSGPILPSLPLIASISKSMHIPVLNVEDSSVKEGIVLASFGVNYHSVGMHAGELAARVLKYEDISLLHPIYPSMSDHHGFINLSQARALNITLPSSLHNVTIVE